MQLPTIFEDVPSRIHRSLSVNDALADAHIRRRGTSDPFLNVEYSCYVQPPVIEKWKYIKHIEQPKVALDQPEALPPLVYIRSSWVDPAAIGVFGFGFGALVNSLLLLVPEYAESNSFQYVIILPGGLQIISGLIDFQRGSFFGAIVFLGYGFMVIGNGFTELIETLYFNNMNPESPFMFVSYIGGTVFSIGAFLISLNMSAVYALLLGVTLAVFILHVIHFYVQFSLIPIGVIWGILAVLSAYIFLAEIVNTVAEKQVIPLGKAVFDYKTLTFVNPFSSYFVC